MTIIISCGDKYLLSFQSETYIKILEWSQPRVPFTWTIAHSGNIGAEMYSVDDSELCRGPQIFFGALIFIRSERLFPKADNRAAGTFSGNSPIHCFRGTTWPVQNDHRRYPGLCSTDLNWSQHNSTAYIFYEVRSNFSRARFWPVFISKPLVAGYES